MLLAAIYCTVLVPVFLYACLLVYRYTRQKNDIPKIDTASSSVDTFIFDLGNVLVRYDWKTYLKSLKFSAEAVQAVGVLYLTALIGRMLTEVCGMKKKFSRPLLTMTRNTKKKYVRHSQK
ncbi:MAG: hypothetical protein ACLRMZ_18195 [Blautia marasmi]